MNIFILLTLLLIPIQAYAGNTFVPGVPGAWPSIPGHLVYFPADYNLNPTKQYPVLFFFHGIDERGDGSLAQLPRVEVNGPPKMIRDNTWDTSLPFIVISPQLPTSFGGWYGAILNDTYNYALRSYRIDKNRIYYTGLSLGGMGMYNLLSTPGLNDKVAAMIPAAGKESNSLSPYCSQIKHVAVWAFHGDQDPRITYAQGKASVLDMQNCLPIYPTKLTTFVGGGHDSWTKAYSNTHGSSNVGGDGAVYTNIYRWLLSFSLDGSPLPPPTNNPPTMTDISSVVMNVDTQVTRNIVSDDADGDILTISFSPALPSFIQFIPSSNGDGQLILNPKSGDEGSYTINVISKDPKGLSVQKSISIAVNAVIVNPPPANSGTALHALGPVNWGGFSIFCDPAKSLWTCAEDVSASGNNKLEFEIRKLAGNQVDDLVIKVQDGVAGVKEVPLRNYITLSGSFQKATISYASLGVTSLNSLKFIGFRAMATGKQIDLEVRNVKFTGGTVPFVYFGDLRPNAGLSKEILTVLEVIQTQPDPTPLPVEPRLHAVGPVNWGGFSIFCDPAKSLWTCAEDVSASGNNKLEFEIRKLAGNQVDDLVIKVQDGVAGVKEVPLRNYITLSGSFQKATISYASLGVTSLNSLKFIGFRAMATGKQIDLEVRNVKFTGGTVPFVYFGAGRTNVGLSKDILTTLELLQ